MQDLIKQYNTTLRQLRVVQKDAKEEDVKILTDMISDITYSLEWMKKARRPGNRRGVERLAAYQRERACDPLLMQRYFRSMDNNLRCIATTATVFSQVIAGVKNIVDTYYKVKEEKQKSRPDQGNDSE